MKILITSGGTRVKIDAVRYITNMSKGTFGSQICSAFAKDNENDITFLYAKNSRMPREWGIMACANIHAVEYDTFDEYHSRLIDLLKKEHFDIIVLAAAVSDYGVENYFDGKYHSSDAMTIKLKPLPKVIDDVRKHAPDSFICGFKLLVNSTEDELKEAMEKQFANHGIDMCVGNDLRDIKNDNHTLLIGLAEHYHGNEHSCWKRYTKKLTVNETLAEVVARRCKCGFDLKKRLHSERNVARTNALLDEAEKSDRERFNKFNRRMELLENLDALTEIFKEVKQILDSENEEMIKSMMKDCSEQACGRNVK